MKSIHPLSRIVPVAGSVRRPPRARFAQWFTAMAALALPALACGQALTSSPASANFPPQTAGTTSVAQSVPVSNASGVPGVAGPFAYITNFDSTYVTVVDVSTNQVVNIIDVGWGPRAIAIAANGGAVYVGHYWSDTVSVIDVRNQVVSGTIAAGNGPRGLALSPDGGTLYVANNVAGTVSVVNTAQLTVVATIPVALNPWGVAVSPDGSKVFVANGQSNSVSVINAHTNRVVDSVAVGARPFGLVVSPDGSKVYVANFLSDSVSVIDTASDIVVATVIVDSGPYGLALSLDGSRLYATTDQNTVSVVDTGTNSKILSIPVGNRPLGIAVTPDGKRAYVTNYLDGRISIIDLATNLATFGPTLADGPASTFANFITPVNVTGTAVEYYYAGFDHYFLTAFPDEQAALDGGAFGGAWVRTGQSFKVWTQPNSFASPVCRFFSTAFGTKSSHFYTPFASECAIVKTYPQWQFEAIGFYMQIPVGFGTGNGDCPGGTTRLYRVYNNGMGGAPNHRYTTSVAILDQMVAAGWIVEGEGFTRVFSCVAN
ncbi:MAG: beta-propeller fold lactonase family protein [Betaproteobacteria bacterium]